MKIKLELEVDVADKDGEKFMATIFENFEHPHVCKQILQRITELSQQRQFEITQISSSNTERKMMFGGRKAVDIKMIG